MAGGDAEKFEKFDGWEGFRFRSPSHVFLEQSLSSFSTEMVATTEATLTGGVRQARADQHKHAVE